MVRLRHLSRFRITFIFSLLMSLLMGLALLALAPGRAHAACDGMVINSDGDWEYDYRICEPRGSMAHTFSGTWYGAIAKSSQSGVFGGSQRAPSRAAAERGALAACTKNGGKSCTVLIWGANNCMALAEYPSSGAWATAPSNYDRSDATTKAANSCRKYAGGRCEVVVSVCGRSAANGPKCIPFHPIDISRGEAWKDMSEEERRMWSRRPNGACKS